MLSEHSGRKFAVDSSLTPATLHFLPSSQPRNKCRRKVGNAVTMKLKEKTGKRSEENIPVLIKKQLVHLMRLLLKLNL